MSARPIPGTPYVPNTDVAIVTDANAELSNTMRAVHCTAAVTIKLPADPLVDQQHRIVALGGGVTVDGNGHAVLGSGGVPNETSEQYTFSVTNVWVPQTSSVATGPGAPDGTLQFNSGGFFAGLVGWVAVAAFRLRAAILEWGDPTADDGDVRLPPGADMTNAWAMKKKRLVGPGNLTVLTPFYDSTGLGETLSIGGDNNAGDPNDEAFDELDLMAKVHCEMQLTDPATVIGGSFQNAILRQYGAGSCVGFQISRYTNLALSGRRALMIESDYGGGQGVFFVGYAVTVPTTNPDTGVLLYTDPADGHLKFRKANGTVIDLG